MHCHDGFGAFFHERIEYTESVGQSFVLGKKHQFMRNMILRQCFFKMQCVMFQVVIVAGYKKTRRQG